VHVEILIDSRFFLSPVDEADFLYWGMRHPKHAGHQDVDDKFLVATHSQFTRSLQPLHEEIEAQWKYTGLRHRVKNVT